MKEVLRKEIIHLLGAGIIYHVKESDLVSSVHCVPKIEGFLVAANKRNDLVPTRTVVGHRICIDLRKLKKN
jgi:hypothetical protein